jgi:uncharacterized protein
MDKVFVLFATEACNYNCAYCEHKDKKEMMSKEIFDDLLEDALDNTKENELISFSLFGGEPLLNFDLVEYVLERCNQYKDKRIMEVNMTTNMSILTEEMLKVFKKYEDLLTIGVSMDGPKDIYNINKTGDFDNVLNNYLTLKKETDIRLGVSMVIDRKYLTETFNNVKYLYNVGFRRFSMFLNLNDWEFLSDKKYAKILDKEFDKINDFIIERYDKIQRFKVERYRLDKVDYIEDIVCEIPNVEYVGVTGNKFNCTRYKYAKGEKKHEHVDWDKCKECEFKPYCCSCWGNDSFIYEDMLDDPNRRIYQNNYCHLIKTMITKTYKHWEKLKEIKKETSVMKYKRKGKEYTLLVNPEKVDVRDDKFIILVDRIPNFKIESEGKFKIMIEINSKNVNKINEIVDYCLKEDATHFEFRFKDFKSWNEDILKEYKNQLNKLVEKMERVGVFSISPIDNILYQNENRFSEKFIENGISYIDPSLEYSFDGIPENFFNGKLVPMCEGCKFNHCYFNPLENKEITNEFIVPSIEQCNKARIEGKAALKFYDKFIG